MRLAVRRWERQFIVTKKVGGNLEIFVFLSERFLCCTSQLAVEIEAVGSETSALEQLFVEPFNRISVTSLTPWWSPVLDRALLVGTYRHGFGAQTISPYATHLHLMICKEVRLH